MNTIIQLPGLIDPHVHLRDPGQTNKEDFFTGTSAALAGGFTTVFDMPNNKIPITTVERLQEKIEIAQRKIVNNIGFYFGSLGDNLDEFGKLLTTLCNCHSGLTRIKNVKDIHNSSKDPGLGQDDKERKHFLSSHIFGLKLYLNETTGNFLIDTKTLSTIFDSWPKENGPILVHAEDDAVAEVISNVKRTGKRVHFCHISLKSDLEQIKKAKEDTLPISCGITPHHLFLTQEDAEKLGPYGRMKPFLKSKKDTEFLWENIHYIDCIESDHAPHTKEEKQSDSPPFGVPGLETTLPLLLTAVNENRLTIEEVIRLCHTGPSQILNIKQSFNTYLEIEMNEEYLLKAENMYTKCQWTPFEGWKAKGKLKRVFMRGKKVFENGKVLVKPGSGQII